MRIETLIVKYISWTVAQAIGICWILPVYIWFSQWLYITINRSVRGEKSAQHCGVLWLFLKQFTNVKKCDVPLWMAAPAGARLWKITKRRAPSSGKWSVVTCKQNSLRISFFSFCFLIWTLKFKKQNFRNINNILKFLSPVSEICLFDTEKYQAIQYSS